MAVNSSSPVRATSFVVPVIVMLSLLLHVLVLFDGGLGASRFSERKRSSRTASPQQEIKDRALLQVTTKQKENRQRNHSDAFTCEDDVFSLLNASLFHNANAEAHKKIQAMLLSSSSSHVNSSIANMFLKRSRQQALFRQEELWTFAAMDRMIFLLREWHDAPRNSEVVLSPSTFVQRDCFSAAWREVSDQLTAVLDRRLQHMGRINNGIIYVCPGFGGLVAMRKKGSSFRAGWFPQQLVADSAAKFTTNFTIFFLTFHDEDIYIKTSRRLEQRVALLNLLREFPNFFLMHYSPSLVMPHGVGASYLGHYDPFYVNGTSVLSGSPRVVGALHPRMIPVPHAPTQQLEVETLLSNASFMDYIRDVVQRKPLVAWRGATTGFPGHDIARTDRHKTMMHHFAATDRYRMVDAFNDRAVGQRRYDWADVAFSGLCQEVTAENVPRFAQKMSFEQLATFRVNLDVDGNTNSWEGLRWRLLLGMAVVKVQSSHGYTQWFYRHLRNGTHILHVPVEGVAHAAKSLLDDISLSKVLAESAYEFGQRHLTLKAMEAAVASSVRDA
ncbi:GPI-anchored surface protein, putative, partial [Bodo saltans]